MARTMRVLLFGLLTAAAAAQSSGMDNMLFGDFRHLHFLQYESSPSSYTSLAECRSAFLQPSTIRQTPPIGQETFAVSTYTSDGLTYATTYAVTPASSGQRTTTELDPAATGLRTTTIGDAVIVQQPPYTTIYQQYTGSSNLASASTVATIPPDFVEDVQGTIIIVFPRRFVTSVQYYTGTSLITEPITETIPPSGDSPGTILI
ncbi:hypothetical protein CLAFUW4_09921 [Fulvia fulva]|uniref:Uncharacterized protein n=1 Tax=Passalora fulva TaxID=5499 RepID=A0A9Q8UUC8_PASFU|nr:uncharacterized protein CLAFUR5_12322 [Fulvia fulva]KAK4617304.1 hypothetical protein CLAFUR0_09920 [Fulvia fulva]UJO22763.1 hypothetical protein CLAFUR5_12322 [Fulvia fulva]WPV19014.1 hypothetical protein CLAFUW4_09921 [Fulvia fulva]